MAEQQRNVAILIFNDVEVLDFAGPFEVFSTANRYGDPAPFNVYTVGVQTGPILARGDLSLNPHYTLETCPTPDLLLIPGGQGTRSLMEDRVLLSWIHRQAEQVEHLLSVCTGALLLARTGLLDGLTVTTHHGSIDLLRAETDYTEVVTDRRFVDNGKILTSAGVSAGIDLALYMVAKLAGQEVAEATAVNMEYNWRPQPARRGPAGETAAAAPDQDALPLEIDPGPWAAEHAYQTFWEAVERDAVRWLWADGPRFDLRPEFFRRQNISRGRRLPEEPEDSSGCYLNALDGEGRVIFARYHFEGAEGMTEYFYRYAPDRVEVASYTLGETLPALDGVNRVLLVDGRPQAYSAYVPGPPSTNEFREADFLCIYRELYTYQDDQLAFLRVIQLDLGQHVSEMYDEAFVYDAVGRLDYIHREYNPENAYIVYQRPQRGQTVAALRDLVTERLLATVPAILEEVADEDDPLYCLALIYDLDDENCLPPVLALGSADARTMLISEHGEEVSNYLWDPEEFQRYGVGEFGLIRLDERDEVLDDACFMLNQQLSFLNRWELARELLNDVARRLMRDTSGPGLAQDFVIYAVDRDFEDFDENFETSVPAERVEAFAAEGLF